LDHRPAGEDEDRDDPPGQPDRITNDDDADADLLRGLLADDRESLSALYDRYGGLAYGLATRTLGQGREAEDVVQEAFLALWRQARRIDPARGLRSYLLTIVHNKAIDQLRRRARRPELALDSLRSLTSEGQDPLESAARQIDRKRVAQAVSALPAEQRQAVELAYFGGFTISEVARREGVAAGTVKSRLRLALARLRRELGVPP
jgi:RNA polymerase sigma factor (sigma-70 family)